MDDDETISLVIDWRGLTAVAVSSTQVLLRAVSCLLWNWALFFFTDLEYRSIHSLETLSCVCRNWASLFQYQ